VGKSVFLFFGVSHAPTARRRGPSAPQFLRFRSIYAHTLRRRTTKFDVTYMGRGLAFRVSHAPYKGRGPSAPQFEGFLCICAYTTSRTTTKFHTVTHMGEVGCFKWSDTRPTPQEGVVLALPNFGDSFLFMHTPFVAEQPNLTW